MFKFIKFVFYFAVFITCLFLVLSFGQPLLQEIKYNINKISGFQYKLAEYDSSGNLVIPDSEKIRYLYPADKDFSIVIPKIGAVAKIFADIDPFNESEFLPVLRMDRLAHVKDTSYPGGRGKIFLFSHSTDTIVNAGKYNTIFYLMEKMQSGDEIDIYFRGLLYKYSVVDNKIISPADVDYKDSLDGEMLMIMTCYPYGTTLKRLIITAKP